MRIEREEGRELGPKANRARRKFLRLFPEGFRDETYVDWERGYKWEAHLRWQAELGRARLREKIDAGRSDEIANAAVRIESRTNLLFSFEKMALRDAVRSRAGARTFAEGLFALLHGRGTFEQRFDGWIEAVRRLPRKQTRVLTWPVLTVFPWIAEPEIHCFLKPLTTKRAAALWGFDFQYEPKPAWPTYASLLAFCSTLERDLADLRPRDRIDTQGFLWVIGSDEYA